MKLSMKILTLISALSLSLSAGKAHLKEAYYAGGCFWGVEYYLENQKGVDSVTSGFMGGHKKDPSYKEVVQTDTGHIETVKVIYDPSKISFENLSKLFFEIHDFTQVDGQGPDIGERYESYLFYNDETEKKVAQKLITALTTKGYKVATKLKAASTFYPADEYHQDYYKKTKKMPYCHSHQDIF